MRPFISTMHVQATGHMTDGFRLSYESDKQFILINDPETRITHIRGKSDRPYSPSSRKKKKYRSDIESATKEARIVTHTIQFKNEENKVIE